MIEDCGKLVPKDKNQCVLIPLKEYNALTKAVNEKTRPDIWISWGYYRHYGAYSFDVGGDIKLSISLRKQIKNIADIINSRVIKATNKVEGMQEETVNKAIDDTIDRFTNLPWYKRLWFNPKYIQK